MPEARRLTDKVAVVTGATRGIGKQTSLLLASRGALLVLVDRSEEPKASTPGTLAGTAAEVASLGRAPLVIEADLSDQVEIDRVVATTLEQAGGVDYLVNNAATTVGKTLWTHAPHLTRSQWEHGFAVNVTASLMLIQGFWESMRSRGGGVVVNLTSAAATMQPMHERTGVPGGDLPDNGPMYGATKAALNRMINVVAQDGEGDNIAVILLDPVAILTETMEATLKRAGNEEVGRAMRPPTIPARAIAYLCECEDPMRYSGQIVNAPVLCDALGL